MRALLDTHAFLWWLEGDEKLSLPARAFVAPRVRVGPPQ
jgi:PIN domain nuclease of toxin-antitoxin system